MLTQPIGFVARIDAYDQGNNQISTKRFVVPNTSMIDEVYYGMFKKLFNNNTKLNLSDDEFDAIFPSSEIIESCKILVGRQNSDVDSVCLNPKQILKTMGYTEDKFNLLVNILSGVEIKVSDVLLSAIRTMHHSKAIKTKANSFFIKHSDDSLAYASTIISLNESLRIEGLDLITVELYETKKVIDAVISEKLISLKNSTNTKPIHSKVVVSMVDKFNSKHNIKWELINSNYDILLTGITYKNCLRDRWMDYKRKTFLFEDVKNKILIEFDATGNLNNINGPCNSFLESSEREEYQTLLNHFLILLQKYTDEEYQYTNNSYSTYGFLPNIIAHPHNLTHVVGIYDAVETPTTEYLRSLYGTTRFRYPNTANILGQVWGDSRRIGVFNNFIDEIDISFTSLSNYSLTFDIKPLY